MQLASSSLSLLFNHPTKLFPSNSISTLHLLLSHPGPTFSLLSSTPSLPLPLSLSLSFPPTKKGEEQKKIPSFACSDLRELARATMADWKCSAALMAAVLVLGLAMADMSEETKVRKIKGKMECTRGWECARWSKYCCNGTISDFFQTYQFEDLFSMRNAPTAHAVGFWDYQSFIIASSFYQPLGFGTTGGKLMGQKEVAAFLGHVGSKTSCGYGVATGGPFAWGLCYNKEMSPSQSYCDESFKYTYPCSPGVDYYGRGALPIYWNFNYGAIGEALKVDLLNHPEYIEQNATLAFQAAIYRWMTPMKKGEPSAHEVFVGDWKPTKNDTLSKRGCGFGTTMNVLYGNLVCSRGEDVEEMTNIISHYLYYLDKMGVGREEAGPHDMLSCAEQRAFNPSGPSSL